jgi:cell shape-determining protein MreC
VRSLISDVLSPLFKTGNFFYETLEKVPKFFSDKNKLIEENKNLSSEIENLHLDIADHESIKDENQKLREELKIKPVGDFISASILAKSPQIPLDTLFLDKGTADGINKGDLVLTGERVLVGKIVEISKNKATATLNSFAGAVSYGFVSRTNEPLEIKGVGGGSIEAKVPIDFDISVGDKIIVGGSLNFLAAIVGVVEEDTSSGFKNILMSLPTDISKINIVFVKSYINE